MTNRTAFQTANELLAANSLQGAWNIACRHIGLNPVLAEAISPLPCYRATSPNRFWIAVAQWIKREANRRARLGDYVVGLGYYLGNVTD